MVEGIGLPTRFHPSFKISPEEVYVIGNEIFVTFPELTGPCKSHKVVLRISPLTYAAYPFPGINVSALVALGKLTYPSLRSAVPLPSVSVMSVSLYENMDGFGKHPAHVLAPVNVPVTGISF
jgi:hypothetical protein